MPIHILTQFIHVQGQAHAKNHLSMCIAIKATKPNTGLSASCKSPIEHVL